MALCEEKRRLVSEYQETTGKFSQAVTELLGKLGKSSRDDYQRLKTVSQERRARSEQARLALEQHVAAHQC